MEDFTRELTPGNTKAAMKAVGAASSDLWKVAPDKLRVLEGFNPRIKNEAYTARVRWIADSIKENGYYPDHPITGFVAQEDGEEVIYVTGGHRRHEAVFLAISEGATIETVPVVIKPRGTSMEDLTVDLKVGNDGEPLSTYEQALLCKRLAGFGLESARIAQRMGYSGAQYVDGLLSLASAPLAVRKMVIEAVISATTAIDAIKKHGDKATDVLLAAMVKSAGGRVTAKHLPDADFKKAVKKHAEPMYTALTKVQADPGFAKLSKEVRELLAELLRGLKKPDE